MVKLNYRNKYLHFLWWPLHVFWHSTMSTALNSISAVVLEDFFKLFSHRTLTERETSYFVKAVVVVMGLIYTALVFVVEKMTSLLQVRSKWLFKNSKYYFKWNLLWVTICISLSNKMWTISMNDIRYYLE